METGEGHPASSAAQVGGEAGVEFDGERHPQVVALVNDEAILGQNIAFDAGARPRFIEGGNIPVSGFEFADEAFHWIGNYCQGITRRVHVAADRSAGYQLVLHYIPLREIAGGEVPVED